MSHGCNQFLSDFELMREDRYVGGLPRLKVFVASRILTKARMMSSGAGGRKCHLGVDFAIWSSGGSGFWLLIDASGEGGTLGASVNEAQAMRDAFLSIEEKLRSSQLQELGNAHTVENNDGLGACC